MKKINTSNETLIVPGVGPVEPGEVVELPASFHNANFKEVPKGVIPRAASRKKKTKSKPKTKAKKNHE